MPQNLSKTQKFFEIAKVFGGREVDRFSQNIYIQIQQFSEHVQGGCCLALSAMWILHGGNTTKFNNFASSTPGGRKVQAIQMLYGFQKTKNGDFGKMDNQYLRKLFSTVDLRVRNKTSGQSLADGTQQGKIFKFLMKRKGLYQLHFQGSGGGHAVAFKNEGGRLSFFDPNYGCVSFPHGGHFLRYFRAIMAMNYPKLNEDWMVMEVVPE